MGPTLILISGLPGCGKTTLARELARTLSIPLFAKDRVQSFLRRAGLASRTGADGYGQILDLAEEQLGLGVSAILDAVFPLPGFRKDAAQIAARQDAILRPIYCFCSDEAVWQARMADRYQYVPHWSPVGWEEVERLRDQFVPWEAEQALFIDAMMDLQDNLQRGLTWIEGKRLD